MPNHYQVLARKWRPRTLKELLGQEATVKTLTHALTHQRLHHAYLFTGKHGVGKTTGGRLLAKCMNCERGISAESCEQCTICNAINQGHCLDLIEVDAASRTKVEDTRDLLENLHYSPAQARFKIYLIDEVHMLSNHSFNALLKTLEEPPAHVKFIFATTHPDRLPKTILSRCLQFHLKNISPTQISAHLETVLKTEKINYELAALNRLAFTADGSMRDALSLLDQAIAFGQGKLTEEDIKTLLGSIEHDDLFIFLEAIAHQDASKIQIALQQLANHHCDYYQISDTLISVLHHIALLQLFPSQAFDFYTKHPEKIKQFAQQFSPEEIQLLYQIALLGRRDLALAPTPKQGFEMLIIRLFTFKPVFLENPTSLQTDTLATTPEKSESTEWEKLILQLKLSGLAHVLAQHCVLHQMQDHEVSLLLSPQQQALLNPETQARLEKALAEHLGKNIKLTIKLGNKNLVTPAEKKLQTEKAKQEALIHTVKKDEKLQSLLSTFSGTIQTDSIETF